MTQGHELEGARSANGVSPEREASETFIRRLHGPWTASDQTSLERRLLSDPDYTDAYRRIQQSWGNLDTYAETPQLMSYRAEALSFARRVQGRRGLKQAALARWRWAAVFVAALALGIVWQASPYGYRPGEFRTSIGEQRSIELDDHSRIILDADTQLRVRYSGETRLVELRQGQVQFSVAKDPARPFKVVAGGRAIIALGTVFTVEYVANKMHVAMIEGRVAVVPGEGSPEQPELSAGQELRIDPSGRATFIPQADLEAATAWREGKVIIRIEPLGEAIRRLNRYSNVRLQIDDPQLATRQISGVFEAGDTQGFVRAIQRIYPVIADYSDADKVRLRLTP